MPKQPKHILVIRLSAMGDVAMIVPVLRALIKQHPEVKITILTKPFFEPIFRNIPNVSVFPVYVKDKHKGVLGLYKLSRELKTLGIDAIADLHNVLRSKILKVFLFRLPFIQIDKGRKEKKALVTGKLFEPLKTTHERYADVFRKFGFRLDLSNPEFPKKTTLSEETQRLFDISRPKIGIAPFAAHIGKMYPLHLMEGVIEELSKDYQIFLFGGGKHEYLKLRRLERKFSNVLFASDASFTEELDVISNLDVMLSMDSGNGHLAAMFGVKVITIWGVTHPYAGFAPFNQPEDYTLLPDRNQYPLIPTSIYGNKYPKGYRDAAGSISPSTIVKKIKAVLSN
ncbi:glycosyltransferase family 9 protein [Flavobacteriaceae bacterium MHTCC 0001]